MQIDWLTIALSGLVSVVLAVLVVWLNKLAQRPPRPIVVRDSSVVGEYMEKYCQHTGLAIDKAFSGKKDTKRMKCNSICIALN